MEILKFVTFLVLMLTCVGWIAKLTQNILAKRKKKGSSPPSREIATEVYKIIGSLAVMCIVSYLLCRPFCHYIIYELLYLFVFGKIILPLLWVSPLIALAIIQLKRSRGARANVGMSLMTISTAIGLLCFLLVTNGLLKSYFLALKFSPKIIETFPIQDPNKDRDTPFEVAVNSMQNQVKKANFEILPDNVHQTIVNGNFGWAGLITSHSSIMRWDSNPGIVTFDDGPVMPEHGRSKLVEFKNIPYAPERYFFSNIYWRLKSERMWGDFDEVYLVQLEDGEHKGWHFAAPFIIQKLRFPGILVPEWGGVVFVEVSTGSFFEKSASELKDNDVYKGLNLFPSSLASLYVEVRNSDSPGSFIYDVWQWFADTEYEIQQSKFDGYNQQPTIYPAVNNETFYMFCVEPKGRSASVLKECHFINTATGEYSKFVAEPGTINPDTACRVVRETLNNHRWGEYEKNESEPWKMAGSSKDSKSLTLEPLPRSVDGKSIFYRVSVTSSSFTGSENSERVFVDGITKETSIYTRRFDYLTLLNDHISPIVRDRGVGEKAHDIHSSVKDNDRFEQLLLEVKQMLEHSSKNNEEMKKFIEEQRKIIDAQHERLNQITPSQPPNN